MAKPLASLQEKVHSLKARIENLVWNESWHPRSPKGTGKGGHFVPKGSSSVEELRDEIKMLEKSKEKWQQRIAASKAKPADPVFGRSDEFRSEVEIIRLDGLLKAARERLALHAPDNPSAAQDVLLSGKATRTWRLPRVRVGQHEDAGHVIKKAG